MAATVAGETDVGNLLELIAKKMHVAMTLAGASPVADAARHSLVRA